MTKEFIPYELALALKELGFDEPCFGYYYTLNGKDWKFAEKSEYYRLDDEINIGGKFSLPAPLYQQAFRWFRDKYNLYNFIREEYKSSRLLSTISKRIIPEQNKGFDRFLVVMYVRTPNTYPQYASFADYEEVELECLKKLIEIVKNK